MPLGLHHLAVVVSDLDRAQAFYVDVLGMPVLQHHHDDAGRPRAIWISMSQGAFLAIERAGADGPRRSDGAPGWHCVALAIPAAEREHWRERLTRAGHPIERESPFSLYVRDPDGNLVALSHHPDPSQ